MKVPAAFLLISGFKRKIRYSHFNTGLTKKNAEGNIFRVLPNIPDIFPRPNSKTGGLYSLLLRWKAVAMMTSKMADWSRNTPPTTGSWKKTSLLLCVIVIISGLRRNCKTITPYSAWYLFLYSWCCPKDFLHRNQPFVMLTDGHRQDQHLFTHTLKITYFQCITW